MKVELVKKIKEEAKIEYEDMQFLFTLLPDWALTVPPNLDPTFYGTLSYEGDMEIKKRLERIKERAETTYKDLMNL